MLLFFLMGSLTLKKKSILLIAVLIGLAIGSYFHPYWPDNIEFTYFYLFQKTSLYQEVQVGNEWYALSYVEYYYQAVFALLFLFILKNYKTRVSTINQNMGYIYTILIVYFILSLYSSRHLQIFLPLLFVFSISILYVFCIHENQNKIVKIAFSGLPILFFIINLYSLPENWLSYRYQNMYNSTKWLKLNTNTNDLIVNLNWSDFPCLFANNTKNTYVWGLDPKYLIHQNPEIFSAIDDFIKGDVSSGILMKKLGSKYLFVNRTDLYLLHRLKNDSELYICYLDEFAFIFQYKNGKVGEK
jgi:hypothetical protein